MLQRQEMRGVYAKALETVNEVTMRRKRTYGKGIVSLFLGLGRSCEVEENASACDALFSYLLDA